MRSEFGNVSVVPADTTSDVFERQIEQFRSMSFEDRMALVDQLTIDVARFAEAGIRATNPNLSAREVSYELARRRFGQQLADDAYGYSSR